MTLSEFLFDSSAIPEDVLIYIHMGNNIIARGHWYQDNIQRYSDHEVLIITFNTQTNTLSVKVRCID